MRDTNPKGADEGTPQNFICNIIDEDLAVNKHGGRVATRFPPEPNGYLHIGHAKSICLNFGIALAYPAGQCTLRFDDTNPLKEDNEYVEAIQRDVAWLGFTWSDLRFASDYFEDFYNYAVELIKQGKAYVCQLTAEEAREYRGTLTEAGRESPYRKRSVADNLELFAKMRRGELPDGSHVLRAKIDMSSGNINMRDPTIYRIRKAHHHRTGDRWCIYPMYDFAHCLSDYIEKITHSICTLEFQDHRPLYDWFLEQVTEEPRPHQYEFARLNLNYTVTSKRRLKTLVDEGHVAGWDDPRMPTIAGLRRRGYTPAAIRLFCERIGVAKKETTIDMGVLEDALRDDLNGTAARAFCVLRPLKVTIMNYPAGKSEELKAPNHPQDPGMGERPLIFSRELWIEQDDFLMNPPPKYFRLSPGQEVRLRYAYVIKCEEAITDPATGEVLELRCTYDPATLGKKPEGRKVKGIVHWLATEGSSPAEVRLYERLFNHANPAGEEKNGVDFRTHINTSSLELIKAARVETALLDTSEDERFQFERLGYFCRDLGSERKQPVFNRAVTLRDSWTGDGA